MSYVVYATPTCLYEIDGFFKRHIDALRNESWKEAEKINAWTDTLHFQINEHAKEQKHLLEQFCKEREAILKEKKREMIDMVKQHYYRSEDDQIRELVDQCRSLKFELLVTSIDEERSISFLKYMTKEQLEQKNIYESSSSNTAKATPLERSSTKDPKRGNKQYERQVSTNEGALRDNKDSRDHGATDTGSFVKQCPFCMMMFPENMTVDERERHVNEH